MKPILARQMEIYAGFLEHTDHHVGRLIDALADLEILDDTLIFYIIGDNGASAEGTLQGTFNEMIPINGFAASGNPGVPEEEHRQVRRAASLQPLCGGLGPCHGHAVPVDQAGRLALGRHPQRHHRPLAQRHQGQGGDPQPVRPRDRRGADGPRSGGPAGADLRQRHPAEALRGREHALLVRRRQGAGAARDAVLRDHRQPRHLPQGLDGGHQAPHAVGGRRDQDQSLSTTTSGSCTTRTPTGRRPTTWPRRCRRSCTSSSACG